MSPALRGTGSASSEGIDGDPERDDGAPGRRSRFKGAAVPDDGPVERRIGSAGFLLSGVIFAIGSGILLLSDVPGASTPVPWTLSNALFFLAIVSLAVGAVAGVRRIPALRTTLAGSLASGILALGALQGLQWLGWKYVDVIAYNNGGHELLFDLLLHPYGVAHAFGYGVLLGSGVAVLAWGFSRTEITHRYLDRAGMVFGATTVLGALVGLLSVAVVGGSRAFVGVVLQFPLLYLWASLVGVSLYRRRHAAGFQGT